MKQAWEKKAVKVQQQTPSFPQENSWLRQNPKREQKPVSQVFSCYHLLNLIDGKLYEVIIILQALRVSTETTLSIMLAGHIGWFREEASYFLIDFQSWRIGMDNQILNNIFFPFISIPLIGIIVDICDKLTIDHTMCCGTGRTFCFLAVCSCGEITTRVILFFIPLLTVSHGSSLLGRNSSSCKCSFCASPFCHKHYRSRCPPGRLSVVQNYQ